MELIEQQSERAKELLTEGPLRLEFWSLAHDGNVRFGVLTTNMSESFNNVLRGARRLPIQALVATTFHRLNKYFVERHEFAKKMTSFCTPSVDVSLKNKRDKARACRVHQYTNNMYEISMDDGRLYQVDLVNMTCTCNHFQMEQIPCTHAIAVCAKINYDFNQLCSRWYTTEAYRGTYAIGFYPNKDKLYWPNTGVRVVPPIARKQPGRPRSVQDLIFPSRNNQSKTWMGPPDLFVELVQQVKLLLEMLIKKCGLNAGKKDDSDDEEKEHYDDE
ncbi:uncharacterized protein [Aristolochia californica]|uniref:uncharacterized protein n=1 Tax=Aristolochia californica TaxID=171875 RepID=UPI0035E2B33F